MEEFDHVDLLYKIGILMEKKGLKSYDATVLDLENAIIEEIEKECAIYRNIKE